MFEKVSGQRVLAAKLTNKALVFVTPFCYRKFLSLGGYSGNPHTSPPHKVLHKKFQFFGVYSGVVKAKVRRSKSSKRSSNSRGRGILECSYAKLSVRSSSSRWRGILECRMRVGLSGISEFFFIPLTASQPVLLLCR